MVGEQLSPDTLPIDTQVPMPTPQEPVDDEDDLYPNPGFTPSRRASIDPTAPHAGGQSDVFWAIAARRSVSHFLPRPVEMDKLLQLVQAGALAPSSGNIQNWSFIVVTDLERIRALYHHTLDQEPFLSAPAAIIVTGDEGHANAMYGMRGKRLYTVQNCAAATQNILLAATALGLGSVWIGAFDEDKVSSLFHLGGSARAQAIILIGYAASVPAPKDMKPLDSIVFFNDFGNKVQRPHLIFYDWATEWRLQAQKVRAHMQHLTSGSSASSTVRTKAHRERVANAKESAAHAMVQTKERMRRVIDGLKKDAYRGR